MSSPKITEELKEVLRSNPPKNVKKPVIAKQKDFKGDSVHQKDEDGNLLYVDAVVDSHPFVYFDVNGNPYFRVFQSKTVEFEGKKVEILVTNPAIKTEKDCTLYAKGIESHRLIIPGSEFWDDGRDENIPHREIIARGDPEYKIVKVMSRDEVLNYDLKPTGDSLVAKIANSSDSEKKVILEQLLGKDIAAKLLGNNDEE